jgi:hypothetical protein
MSPAIVRSWSQRLAAGRSIKRLALATLMAPVGATLVCAAAWPLMAVAAWLGALAGLRDDDTSLSAGLAHGGFLLGITLAYGWLVTVPLTLPAVIPCHMLLAAFRRRSLRAYLALGVLAGPMAIWLPAAIYAGIERRRWPALIFGESDIPLVGLASLGGIGAALAFWLTLRPDRPVVNA